jgi:hypothetical protein
MIAARRGNAMPSRLAIFVLFVNLSPVHLSHAQQVTSEVVIPGASVNDGYQIGWTTCGIDGQLYRHPADGHLRSVMRVARDGSTLIYALPDEGFPMLLHPMGTA